MPDKLEMIANVIDWIVAHGVWFILVPLNLWIFFGTKAKGR
jgi:hypothetical protein